MSLPRALLLAAASTLSASLEAISFDFTFSDAGATQTLTGTIDVSALSNQTFAYWSIYGGSVFNVNSLSTTLTGVPGYDGAYGLSYFSDIYLSIPNDLNQAVEMVGQYSAAENFTFGNQRTDGKGMFLFFSNSNAPGFTYDYTSGYAAVRLFTNGGFGQTMLLTSFRPSGPATITTTINASDARVMGGSTLQFQGGTFAPVGAGTLSLSNNITVLAGSTGTIDATGQNIASTGAVTINGTSLTLTGSATSTVSLSGNISGAGVLINAGGNNTISGANTSAGISVTGGALRIGAAGALPGSGNTVSSGGTLIIPANLNASGAVSIAGNGAVGQAGALVFDATSGGDFGSAITLTADAKVGVIGSDQVYARGIDGSSAGKTLTIDTGSGVFFPDGGIGSNIAHVVKEGSGTLYLRASVAGDVTVNAGTYYAGYAFSTGQGVTVNAGAQLLLCSDNGTQVTFTSPVTLAGSQTMRLDSGAQLTQSGQVTLAANSSIISRSENHTISGAIAGATTGQQLTLQVDDHALTISGSTASSIAQVTKEGSGVLKLDTTATVDSAVVVSNGLLTNNGAINGAVTVATNAILGGSGTIGGTVTVAGTLAPGNSPGVLTQTSGDANLSTGSSFSVQLGGTTAGNGDGFHDQYRVQAGAFNLANGVTLNVGSWVMADGTTTFVPARRDVFNLIYAANGITGAFADMVNADYAQWLLFDNRSTAHNAGKLYGTGLNGN
jgi:hypothetical protein